MGADFLGTFIPDPRNTHAEARAAFDAMPDEDVLMHYDYVHSHPADTVAEARIFFLDALTEFYTTIVPHRRRDVGYWQIDGRWYYVTGGLSWGEPPTDAYTIIEAVDTLNVT